MMCLKVSITVIPLIKCLVYIVVHTSKFTRDLAKHILLQWLIFSNKCSVVHTAVLRSKSSSGRGVCVWGGGWVCGGVFVWVCECGCGCGWVGVHVCVCV